MITIPAKQNKISEIVHGFQTGSNKWKLFLPSVTGQMLSEIRMGKSQKLAPPHYVLKSESDEIVKK